MSNSNSANEKRNSTRNCPVPKSGHESLTQNSTRPNRSCRSLSCPSRQGKPHYKPGFEQGSNGWTISTIGLGGTQNGISPHSGNLQVYTVGNFPGAGVGQTLATTPGATYTVSFFLAAAVAPGGTLDVLWGGSTVFSHVFNSLSGYTPYTFNVTASNASTALRFSFGGRGQQFLDDISVTPAGVPDGGSTVSLLGCALLGVAVLRRKLRC